MQPAYETSKAPGFCPPIRSAQGGFFSLRVYDPCGFRSSNPDGFLGRGTGHKQLAHKLGNPRRRGGVFRGKDLPSGSPRRLHHDILHVSRRVPPEDVSRIKQPFGQVRLGTKGQHPDGGVQDRRREHRSWTMTREQVRSISSSGASQGQKSFSSFGSSTARRLRTVASPLNQLRNLRRRHASSRGSRCG